MKRFLIYLFVTLSMLSCDNPVIIDTFGSISGTVHDAKTISPLPGVKVAITPLGYSQVTGNDGSFLFDNLDIQEYTITFEKDGYQPQQQKISLKPGIASPVQVSLTPLAVSLTVSPSLLDFGATETSLRLQLGNSSATTVSYSVITSNSWITVSQSSGQITQSDYLTVLVSRSGLSPGDYSGEVLVTYAGGTLQIPVKMKILANDTPVVTIEAVSGITATSANISGNLSSIGTSVVSKMGFCWSSTNQTPTISDNSSNQGDAATPRSFNATLSNLNPETMYYCRAYAQNSEGIAYSSNTISFNTLASGSVTPGADTTGIAVRQGLMAYYTFDNSDAKDATDLEIDGQLVNAPTFIDDTPNGKGKAIFLNGTKEQLVNINYNLFKGLSSFTIAMWVKDFSTGSLLSGIRTDYKSVYYTSPYLYLLNEGKVSFCCNYGYNSFGQETFSFKYTSLQASGWHHLSVTCRTSNYSTNLKLFVDGVLVDDVKSYWGDNAGGVTKIQIGGNGEDVFPVYLTAKLDNVRIYSRDLDNSEVSEIFNYEKKK